VFPMNRPLPAYVTRGFFFVVALLERLFGLLTIRPYRCHGCNFRFYAWWGLERRSVPRLTRAVLRLLAGAAVIVASFWIPVRILGGATGAIMGVVLWIGTARVMGS